MLVEEAHIELVAIHRVGSSHSRSVVWIGMAPKKSNLPSSGEDIILGKPEEWTDAHKKATAKKVAGNQQFAKLLVRALCS